MKFRIGTLSALTVAMLTITGCTNYYKVSDPSTGKTYYTTNLEKKSGATVLKDARTGSEVSIQNSEVKQISEEEFNTARAQK